MPARRQHDAAWLRFASLMPPLSFAALSPQIATARFRRRRDIEALPRYYSACCHASAAAILLIAAADATSFSLLPATPQLSY